MSHTDLGVREARDSKKREKSDDVSGPMTKQVETPALGAGNSHGCTGSSKHGVSGCGTDPGDDCQPKIFAGVDGWVCPLLSIHTGSTHFSECAAVSILGIGPTQPHLRIGATGSIENGQRGHRHRGHPPWPHFHTSAPPASSKGKLQESGKKK